MSLYVQVSRKLGGEPGERLRARGIIVGTPEIVEQLGSLAEAGFQRVMSSGSRSTTSIVWRHWHGRFYRSCELLFYR
jgi:hypothetical protein